METTDSPDEAVTMLQQLGLKEYEAKCFVALSRVPKATAKEISEIADVPRTRVYDAIRVLEAEGLTEVQHTSPQQFRAVPLEEAIDTLRDQYEARMERLQNALDKIGSVESDAESSPHEVWSLSGRSAIENRTQQLVDEADGEVVIVLGRDSTLSDGLCDRLNAAATDGRNVVIGTPTDQAWTEIQSQVPNAEVFVSGLEWLHGADEDDSETSIGLMAMIDRGTILISAIDPETSSEHAVFGRGFKNGLVVIVRRLMATGLLPSRDPGSE